MSVTTYEMLNETLAATHADENSKLYRHDIVSVNGAS